MEETLLRHVIHAVFAPKKDDIFVIVNDYPDELANIDAVELTDYDDRRSFAVRWHNELRQIAEEIGFAVEPIVTIEPTFRHGAPLPIVAKQESEQIDLRGLISSLHEDHVLVALTKFSASHYLFTHIRELSKAGKQPFRCASMPGVLSSMTALYADYGDIYRRSHMLSRMLADASGATVEFSDRNVCFFDLRYRKGIADDGRCHVPGEFINLPSGEACIAPVEGKPFSEEGSKTEGTIPIIRNDVEVRVKVRDNSIVDVIPISGDQSKIFPHALGKNGYTNVAEFGLGCNYKATLIGNILQDEKAIGFHWAFGANSHLDGLVGADAFPEGEKPVHEDFVYSAEAPIGVDSVVLHFDNDRDICVMAENTYTSEVLRAPQT